MTELRRTYPIALTFDQRPIHITDQTGEPWFVGREICEVLGIRNTRDALGRLDDDERADVGIPDVTGRLQDQTIINESGLYSLILRSRKPEAKRFKRWVTHEVLPQIRATGGYGVPQADLSALTDQIAQLSAQVAALTVRLAPPPALPAPFAPPTEWSGFAIDEVLSRNLHIAMRGVYEWVAKVDMASPGFEPHASHVWAPGIIVSGTKVHPGPGAYAWSSNGWVFVHVSVDIWAKRETPAGRWLIERIVERYQANAELLRWVEGCRRLAGKRGLSDETVAQVYERFAEAAPPALAAPKRARKAA